MRIGAATGSLVVYVFAGVLVFAANTVRVGTVNDRQGQFSTDGAHTIRTNDGMAELLLTPGCFLRLGNHTTVSVGTGGGSAVQVQVHKGEVMLEAIAVPDPEAITLDSNGATTTVEKPGLYDLNTDRGTLAVYQGAAQVAKGEERLEVLKGYAAKVSRRLREYPASVVRGSMLYAYSAARSRQLSDESAASAQTYSGMPGSAAWYWNPLWNSYSYLPASGFVNGPFGWPFYAPGYSHNYVPAYRGGDSYLYGPPVPAGSGGVRYPLSPPAPPATVPLNAPGVPSFPSSRNGPPR